MSAFDDFLKEVLSDAEALAKSTLNQVVTQAINDTREFLDEARSDLREWTDALAMGEMSTKEFTDLVEGQRDLAKLHGLTAAGITATKLDRFRDALMKLVVQAALKTFI